VIKTAAAELTRKRMPDDTFEASSVLTIAVAEGMRVAAEIEA
jgi:hypothetical protein